jgi:hypothetical protein
VVFSLFCLVHSVHAIIKDFKSLMFLVVNTRT